MLRHLAFCGSRLARLAALGSIACSPAAPVEVGIDYFTPALESDPSAEVEPASSEGSAEDGDGSGQMDPLAEFDSFVNRGWERGEVSPHCHSSFQACGGLLAGTWVVEDNCNPEMLSPDVLREWGKSRMDLDQTACWDAVQRLRWTWRGELRFEEGEAIDNRERLQQVDMRLTPRCLSASFGIEEADSVSPQVCEALQDDATTCALAGGVCLCTNRTVSRGTASGVYGVLGLSVAIAANPTTRYEYCVNGDRLLWREKEGAQRQVVMVRTEDAPPGAVDPIEIPR